MKAILLAAIAVTLAVILLREQPPAPPPAAPPPKIAAAPKPLAVEPEPPKAPPAPKVAAKKRVQPKAVAALTTKIVEPPPEVVPVAAIPPSPAPAAEPPAAPAPLPAAPAANPNSVFEWGPWAGGEPAPAGGGEPAPREPVSRAEGFAPGVSVASSGPSAIDALPPVVAPPPVVVQTDASRVRGGHGWGDRNHIHVHRRER